MWWISTWHGKYWIWKGKYLSWCGKYPICHGKYCLWKGKYLSWCGEYPTWHGKYWTWKGKYLSWCGEYLLDMVNIGPGRVNIWVDVVNIILDMVGKYLTDWAGWSRRRQTWREEGSQSTLLNRSPFLLHVVTGELYCSTWLQVSFTAPRGYRWALLLHVVTGELYCSTWPYWEKRTIEVNYLVKNSWWSTWWEAAAGSTGERRQLVHLLKNSSWFSWWETAYCEIGTASVLISEKQQLVHLVRSSCFLVHPVINSCCSAWRKLAAGPPCERQLLF